jgi:hypothetical protein
LLAFRLASHLGYLDVDSMLDQLTSSQFLEWLEFYQLEPYGYELDNYRAGIIASAIYNTNRSKESDKVFEPKDFFQSMGSNSKAVTSDEKMELWLTNYAQALNTINSKQ